MLSLRWHDHTALMAHISVWQTPIPQDDSDDLSPPSQTSPPRSTPARLLGTTFVLPPAGRKCVPTSCAEDQTALRQDEGVFQYCIRQKIHGGRAGPSASRTPPASDTAPHIPLYPIPSPCRYENLVARQPGCRTTCMIMSWTYMRSSHGVMLTPWRSSYSTHVVQIHSRRGTFG